MKASDRYNIRRRMGLRQSRKRQHQESNEACEITLHRRTISSMAMSATGREPTEGFWLRLAES